ncbi:HlyD family efflux transporter periplasmic adaptor subunit [Labilibaculum sp. DW002]|uniref:HlyD family efflux transporter periplasmic adaptor subunit n=1 Tax=Paralabilibaculum antarcticum TaxID=2912572 RepID=A0ABT5VY54_9BACT|nr:HlyD family efflux transporter periplasmic adaptor subunit [Labilibaculum sp. DW002]MDE5420195.1 HlyD family efflux transporter periplasmic adaptor subunit [Labilibaculum sp. DW002]
MKTIFPKEIIDHTTEAHFAKFNSNIKIIYLLVIVLLIAGVLALPVVNVPITQQGRGTIRSLNENNNVISAIYGQIAENRLHENLQVIKGDTLLILNAQKLDNELKSLGSRLDLNNEFRKDLEMLINSSSKRLQTFLYQNELEEYNQNLIELDADIKQKKRDFDLNKTLYEKEVVAKVDFEKIEYELQQTHQNKDMYVKQKNLKWQTSLRDLVNENMDLETSIIQNNKEKQNYVITAPISGSITHFTGIQAGNFLAPGQTICQISPASGLIVECYLSPSDIGYIRKEMSVNFQMDAFNYNQWGLGNGRVIEISPDIFQIENNAYFKVRCSIDQKHLKLKNGYEGNLTKGMSLTARFQVTERTLFQLLYDNVDDWLNPRLKS